MKTLSLDRVGGLCERGRGRSAPSTSGHRSPGERVRHRRAGLHHRGIAANPGGDPTQSPAPGVQSDLQSRLSRRLRGVPHLDAAVHLQRDLPELPRELLTPTAPVVDGSFGAGAGSSGWVRPRPGANRPTESRGPRFGCDFVR